MKLENWMLVQLNPRNDIIGLTHRRKHVTPYYHTAVAGWAQSRGKVETFIHTSTRIVEFTRDYVRTSAGIVYELGLKHSDFLKYEMAIKENKLVLGDWRIKRTKSGKIIFFGRNLITGLPFEGTVIAQDTSKHELTFKNGRKAFVDWNRVSATQTIYYMLHLNEMKESNFNEFCGFNREPRLF